MAAFYRNAYRGSLVQEWLPALDGVTDRLKAGAKIADVGCGHGHSTILMAQAFPNSTFWGFDTHEESTPPGKMPPRPGSPTASPLRSPRLTPTRTADTT